MINPSTADTLLDGDIAAYTTTLAALMFRERAGEAQDTAVDIQIACALERGAHHARDRSRVECSDVAGAVEPLE